MLIAEPERLRGMIPDGDRFVSRLLGRVLAEMDTVLAGRAGRLRMGPIIDVEDDGLCQVARLWKSLTPYRPTRYGKHGSDEAKLAEDIRGECRRRGFPEPFVEVYHLERGPRGGLQAMTTLRFDRPVRGPLLLGKSCHFGAGLFQAVSETIRPVEENGTATL